MRKNTYRIYAVLILGLMLLFSIPAQVQQTLRNQFLRPLLPFGHLIPIKTNKFLKNYPTKKIKLAAPQITSYPGSTMAKIVYRNPSTWSDFFWINIGEKANKDKTLITFNSPVLYDGALIGLVDYVGEKQSRVQLITNSSLTISVRALRGKDQYTSTLKNINELLNLKVVQNQNSLCQQLSKLKQSIEHESLNWYLAKGELYGTSLPLWRSQSQVLLGKGFNCEFADEYGVKRDLISGKSIDQLEIEIPIIKSDDLLITTGLDGVFPEGLQIARVTEVEPLVEGGFSYSLKANPITSNLNELQFVEVILPVEYRHEKVQLRAFSN